MIPFCHENHTSPYHSMGSFIYQLKRSDLLSCLEYEDTACSMKSPSDLHAKIFDGPATIYILTNKQVRTFNEYKW